MAKLCALSKVMIVFTAIVTLIASTLTPVLMGISMEELKGLYTVYNLLAVTINMFTAILIANEKLFNKLDNNFGKVVIADTVVGAVIVLMGIQDPLIRVFGLTVLGCTTTLIWSTLFRRALNRYMSGDTLTHFTNTRDKYANIMAFVGAVIAIPISQIPGIIVYASLGEIILLTSAGIVDVIIRRKLMEKIQERG